MRIQRLVSFDIGIKNMAYCMFDMITSPPTLQKWEVLNLMDNVITQEPATCTCHLKTKKNAPVKVCGRKAKYTKSTVAHYCEKHALESADYILPNKEFSPPSLKKLKYEDLITLSEKYGVFAPKDLGKIVFEPPPPPQIPSTKKDLLAKMLAFFEEKSYNVIISPKKKTAGETDLISIGKNMTRLLDAIPEMVDGSITHVILENQIGILANRMKTIQGMLSQYYIMRGRPDIHIEFVSSSNKLKDFSKAVANGDVATQNYAQLKDSIRTADESSTKLLVTDLDIAPQRGANSNPGLYKQHKKDGILFCTQLLEANAQWAPQKELWNSGLTTTKRDDLADCFLQGIWYLKREKIITYAEDLKINSVSLS
jgi:hypothetical protein